MKLRERPLKGGLFLGKAVFARGKALGCTGGDNTLQNVIATLPSSGSCCQHDQMAARDEVR